MDPDQIRVVRDIYQSVVDAAEADRDEIIRHRCGGDADLEARVRAMLAATDDVTDARAAVDRQAASTTSTEAFFDQYRGGTRIGSFVVREILGEGGFATVYLADQEQPVRRRVALKVIKRGMETQQVVARFEAERQALALMDHPGVAKVFDAGTTDDGRPYFAMEYVPGLPMIEYCDRHRLSIDDRLDLFIRVCEAVQHAHQKGIIHRDLKPSNILVTTSDDDANPKVIDFGIAKALSQRLTEQTIFTEQGHMIGTPEYMSPEQAERSAHDIDTRSDIYSLGVLLYELLTGVRPFDLRDAALLEVQRQIVEVDPERPSTRLSSLGEATTELAKRRRTDTRSIARRVRGDLDWIVMKCLEKDRVRRYETANALAMDIRRHRQDEPVLAGPPSASYRLTKFVRRNRGGVIAAGLVLAVLLAGVSTTAWGLIQANAARERAEKSEKQERERANELQQVADYQSTQLAGLDPQSIGIELRRAVLDGVRTEGRKLGWSASEIEQRADEVEAGLAGVDFTGIALTTVDDHIFEPAVTAISEQFPEQPAVRAQLLLTLTKALLEAGLFDRAVTSLDEVISLNESLFGREDPRTLEARHQLGFVYLEQSRLTEAEMILESLVESLTLLNGPDHLDTIRAKETLAHVYSKQGRLDECLTLYEHVLRVRQETLGKEHPQALYSLYHLTYELTELGRYDESEAMTQDGLATCKRVLGPTHSITRQFMDSMGGLLEKRGVYAEARAIYEESLRLSKEELGNEHPSTLNSMIALARVLVDQGQYDSAAALVEDVVATLGTTHLMSLRAQKTLATIRTRQGRFDEAVQIAEEALLVARRIHGPRHRITISYLDAMGHARWGQGRFDEAIEFRLEQLEACRALGGDDHIDTISSIASLAGSYVQAGQPAAAEPLYEEAIAAKRRFYGPEHPRTLESMNGLAAAYLGQAKFDAAETMFLEILEISDTRDPGVLQNLAVLYQEQKRFDESERMIREAIEVQRTLTGEDDRLLATLLNNLAGVYWVQERYPEALTHFQEAWDIRRRTIGETHIETLESMNNIGQAYWRLGQYEESASMFADAHALQSRALGTAHSLTSSTRASLARGLRALGRTEEITSLIREELEVARHAATRTDATADEKNRLAWVLLTVEPSDLRDIPTALEHARQANVMTDHSNPAYLDTLARAHFMSGDTARAIELQERAIQLLPADDPNRVHYDTVLTEYQAGDGGG